MSQPQSKVSWADIPPEVVEQILDHCDHPSLLNLGRVNKNLNKLALQAYLGSKVVDRLDTDGKLDISGTSYRPPLQPTRALCLAFWIPNITTFDHYLLFRDYDDVVHEFRCITAFLRHMSAPTLKVLNLSARRVLGVVPGFVTVDGKRHLEIWSGLMEAALSKGCKELNLSETSVYIQSTPPNSVPPQPPLPPHVEASARPWSLLQSARDANCRSMDFDQSPSDTGTPGLKSLRLDVPSLLDQPLLPYTLQILGRNAESIEHLCCHAREEGVHWNEFFSGLKSVKFHRLEHFTFQGESRIAAQRLYDFLGSQRTITEIDFDAIISKRPDCSQQVVSLPHLRSLQTGPLVPMEWFFNKFRTPNLDRIIVPRLFSSMVDITSDSFDNIMLGLSCLKIASSVTFEINISPYDERWMSGLEKALGGFQSRCRLSGVPGYKKVKLIGQVPRQQRLMDILPRWMALFPSLQDLTFSLCDPGSLEDDLVQAIAERCPNLEKVQARALFSRAKARLWEVRDGVCKAIDCGNSI